jgi:hypothetical protein
LGDFDYKEDVVVGTGSVEAEVVIMGVSVIVEPCDCVIVEDSTVVDGAGAVVEDVTVRGNAEHVA